jgi:hypothetical protein
LAAALEGASALYVFPGLWTSRVGVLCNQSRVLSLSGMDVDAESGKVAVALGIANGKPEIVVHLPKSRAEGHQLSSRLLKLARVIR